MKELNMSLTWNKELNAYMQGYGGDGEAQGFYFNEDKTWSRCLDSSCGFQISDNKYKTILECLMNDSFGS